MEYSIRQIISKLKDKNNYQYPEEYQRDLTLVEDALLNLRSRVNELTFIQLDNSNLTDEAKRQFRDQYFTTLTSYNNTLKDIIDNGIVLDDNTKEQLRIYEESLRMKHELKKRNEQDNLIKSINDYFYVRAKNPNFKPTEKAIIVAYEHWLDLKYDRNDKKRRTRIDNSTIQVGASTYRFSIKQSYLYDFANVIIHDMYYYLKEVQEFGDSKFYDKDLLNALQKWLVGNTENTGLIVTNEDPEALKRKERELAVYKDGDNLNFDRALQDPLKAATICAKGNKQLESILKLAFTKNIKIESFNTGYQSQNGLETVPMISFSINEKSKKYMEQLINELYKVDCVEIQNMVLEEDNRLIIRFNPFDKEKIWGIIETSLNREPISHVELAPIIKSLFDVALNYDHTMGSITTHYYHENGMHQMFIELGNSNNGLDDNANNYINNVNKELEALGIPRNGLELLNISDEASLQQTVIKLNNLGMFLIKEVHDEIQDSLSNQNMVNDVIVNDIDRVQKFKQNIIDKSILMTSEKGNINKAHRAIVEVLLHNNFNYFTNEEDVRETLKNNVHKIDFWYSIFKTMINYQVLLNNVKLNKAWVDIEFENLVNNNGIGKCVGILMSDLDRLNALVDRYIRARYVDNNYEIIDNYVMNPKDVNQYNGLANALYDFDKYMGYVKENEISQPKVV